MAPKKNQGTLRSPFLKRICFEKAKADNQESFPFSIPIFRKDFILELSKPITIFVGENGSGKSTFLEFIASLCDFNLQGGSHNHLYDTHGRESLEHIKQLAMCTRLSWLPKMSTGFFFRAETFFNFAEYILDPELELDLEASYGGDLLKKSHGESFLTFFSNRLNGRGIYLFDEPEAALSPTRQLEFLRILKQVEDRGNAQVIFITHSPLLMAYPYADLFMFGYRGISKIALEGSEHFRVMSKFYKNPHIFIEESLNQESE
jgi:predicted ATPase